MLADLLADLVAAGLAGLAGRQAADVLRLCSPTGPFLANHLAELPNADNPPVSAPSRLSARVQKEHLACR